MANAVTGGEKCPVFKDVSSHFDVFLSLRLALRRATSLVRGRLGRSHASNVNNNLSFQRNGARGKARAPLYIKEG